MAHRVFQGACRPRGSLAALWPLAHRLYHAKSVPFCALYIPNAEILKHCDRWKSEMLTHHSKYVPGNDP